MSSLEHRRLVTPDAYVASFGSVDLLPNAATIEHFDSAGNPRWRPLVTKQSLQFYQQTSHRYGQTIAFQAWGNLSTCVPGTAHALRQEDRITSLTPEFSEYAALYPSTDAEPDQIEVLGYFAEDFPSIAREAFMNREYIPRMGPTVARFLLDLAGVVEKELRN